MPSSEDNTTRVMTMIGDKLQLLEGEDSFDRFGKDVADRLRAVNTDQVKFAMKLIGDILFEANMTSLTRNSKIVAVGETQCDFRSPTGCYEWQQNLPLRFQGNQCFRPEIPQQQCTSQNAGQHQRCFPNTGPNTQIPQQIGQHRHNLLEIGQQQHTPQQQSLPLDIPTSPSEAANSGGTPPCLKEYVGSFQPNNA
jgi:hypothetical protein